MPRSNGQVPLSQIPKEIGLAEIRIPAIVRKNAEKGLELRKKYGRGGTAVGVNTAVQLRTRVTLPWVFVRKIAQYFPRHSYDNLEDKTSNGYIAWMLWGGDAGWVWASRVVKQGESKAVAMRRGKALR